MAITLDQFVTQVADSSLMSAAEVHALVATLPENRRPRDGEQLARELVRQKKLTAYQAQQIYAGKGRSLVLGNYLILDKLGQGGMGLVLKAEHRRMERLVALKVLSPKVVQTPETLRRFQREVKAAARLTHPNIVIAHDADEAGGTHFLVMEYVDGTDLSSVVKERGRLPLEQALDCLLQAARGLQYAHENGVVHRDIKPANLLCDRRGTVKILDMGLARLDSADSHQDQLTGTGQIMGTVDYMAPEQARNTKYADARADIYSLGVTLWYLLTGRSLFEGETTVEKLLAHQTQPVPSLQSACPNVSPALDAVFRKMVAKAPEARYQTMAEVLGELERCLAGGAASAPLADSGAGDETRFSEFLHGLQQGSWDPRPAGSQPATRPAPAAPAIATRSEPMAEPDVTMDLRTPQTGTDPQTQAALPHPSPSARRESPDPSARRGSPDPADTPDRQVSSPSGRPAVGGSGAVGKPATTPVGRPATAQANRRAVAPWHRKPLVAIGGGLAALALCFGIIVLIRNKGGEEVARVNVPDSGSVEIVQDGKGTAEVPAKGATRLLDLGNGVTMELIGIPPGEFLLGSTKEEQAWAVANKALERLVAHEGKGPRKATINGGFWLGRTEVTLRQWRAFAVAMGHRTDAEKKGFVDYAPRKGENAGRVDGLSWRDPELDSKERDDHPITCVSWNDASALCAWATERERGSGRLPKGCVVRLPTEAEWEYACRAGSQSKFWWGESQEDGKGRLNWGGTDDGFAFTSPVDAFGDRGRNRFGLADMLGNVFEWCLDDFDASQAHVDCHTGSSGERAMRGGACDSIGPGCRCAYRFGRGQSHSGRAGPGFRVCLGPDVLGSASAVSSAPPVITNWRDVMPLVRAEMDKKRAARHEDGWAVLTQNLGGSIFICEQLLGDIAVRGRFRNECQIHLTVGGSQFYCASLRRNVGNFLLRRYVGSKGNTTLESQPLATLRYASADEHDFLITKVGDLVSAWVDGTFSGSARDSALTSGTANVYLQHPGDAIRDLAVADLSAAAPAAAGDWTTLPNGWRVGKPVNLGRTVNSAVDETCPTVSGDGLTLLFASVRTGGVGANGGIWACTRRSTTEPWGVPRNLDDVNSASSTSDPCLSPDGLTLAFASTRPGGSRGQNDAWMATRRSAAERWENARNLGAVVNSEHNESQPFLSADGLTLLFRSDRLLGQGGVTSWMCTRPTIGAPWTVPVNFGTLMNSHVEDSHVRLFGDGLALFFASGREGGQGSRALWMSTRRSRAEPFGKPVNLSSTFKDSARESAPWFSADSHTLYFDSNRPGGEGGRDLWQAPLVPPDAPAGSQAPDLDARFSAFGKEIASLPAEQQVARVAAKLKELNPGFDGKETHRIENDAVTELSINTLTVKEIWPVGALHKLQQLHLGPGSDKRSSFSDLSPLAGLRLRLIDCPSSDVSDLSPLIGQPLEQVTVAACSKLLSLSPLKGMKLQRLNITNCTSVTDFSVLQGMPLDNLECQYTRLRDLSPLRGAPLKLLRLTGTEVTDLSPLQDAPLEELDMGGLKIINLSPLKKAKLRKLQASGSALSDLSALRGAPLKFLNTEQTRVTDLTPLRGMPLEDLTCDFVSQRDTEVLRSIKTLKKINRLPAAEFWKKVAADEVPKPN